MVWNYRIPGIQGLPIKIDEVIANTKAAGRLPKIMPLSNTQA